MEGARQGEYIVEYLDGPLSGGYDRRYLVSGEPDDRVSAVAAVEGVESTFWYQAVERTAVGGTLHVRYRFDADHSDSALSDAEDDRANDAFFR